MGQVGGKQEREQGTQAGQLDSLDGVRGSPDAAQGTQSWGRAQLAARNPQEDTFYPSQEEI